MMKCLFIHDFRSYKKGEEVYTTNLSYEILKERYVDIFGEINILNRSGEMSDVYDEKAFVKASGEKVNFLNEISIFTPLSFLKNYRRIKENIYKNVSASEYIIIRLDSFMGLIAAKYCRKHRKKYLIEVVGCVWDSFWNKGLYGKIVAIILLKRMQKEVKYSPYTVYVTKKFLQTRYPTEGQNTNISNVHLDHLDELNLLNRLKRIETYTKEQIFQIVTVASVEVRYKGQETVIKALAELKKQGHQEFRYHLIGGGDNSFLTELADRLGVSDQIFFYGSLNHEKVMKFLDNCDIYIQPSKQEGLPRALIEGMSKGLFCLGTHVAGIPELLDKDMLFSTKRNSYLEIVALLLKKDKQLYRNQAIRNFNEAKKYETTILEQKRKDFFELFKLQKVTNIAERTK